MTTREEDTRILITRLLEELEVGEFTVWFPKKEMKERHKGKFVSVEQPMFSSYLFIFWDGENELEFPFLDVRRIPTVIRILRYDDGSHQLKGKDNDFAKWLHLHSGFIRQSKVVYREGQKIHICEGPLTGFDGNVVKVDKHHKRIVLRFEVCGNTSDVSFSVEFLNYGARNEAGEQRI